MPYFLPLWQNWRNYNFGSYRFQKWSPDPYIPDRLRIPGSHAALFDPESNKEETEETPSKNPDENKEENKETTEVVDVDTLFTNKPESVGSEDNKEQEGTSSKEETSPNFYSSIAKTFVEDGVFQDLNDEALSKVNDAESFMDLMEEQIQSKLDEKQKRIDQALNAGIEPTQVQR